MADAAREENYDGNFDQETHFPEYLNHVLDKALELTPDSDREIILLQYLELLKYTIELINEFKDGDVGIWDHLGKQFHDIYIFFNKSIIAVTEVIPSVINEWKCTQQKTGRIGRPSYNISGEALGIYEL